jgi:hypothetical protein
MGHSGERFGEEKGKVMALGKPLAFVGLLPFLQPGEGWVQFFKPGLGKEAAGVPMKELWNVSCCWDTWTCPTLEKAEKLKLGLILPEKLRGQKSVDIQGQVKDNM